MRVGIGVTGNSAIDPYQTKGAIIPLYYPFGNSLSAGYAPSEPIATDGNGVMGNHDLTWEKPRSIMLE